MIRTENLTRIFRTEEVETIALNGVNIEVEDGEFIAIMGPSGCGKSTLLNILGLLDSPTEGKYWLNNEEVGHLKERERTAYRKGRIGFVFQNFNLISRTNARKNVELPMMYAGIPQKKRTQRAEELLDLVGMADRMDHQPNELSGGQKQRVAIARAMANDPAIILADEPTGALDSKTGRMVMDLFHRLNREQGKTIVLITHNQELAAETSRVLTMRDGILYTGSERGAREDGTR